ncbi:MAG TPA: hypothetical protein VNS32_05750 [Flavisolibacter sp.]|nr:hypothetical protein [Flavisolibacter sp.]
MKYYGIKLRYEHLCPEPYFRFDSDGPTHRNKCPHIPLEDQSITTPHFNVFDVHGCYLAFKTPQLEDPGNCKAIVDDINFGVIHFCNQSNLRLNEDEFPEVTYPNLLGSIMDSSDPHDSIQFDIN